MKKLDLLEGVISLTHENPSGQVINKLKSSEEMDTETNSSGIEKLRFNADDQQTKSLPVTNEENSPAEAVNNPAEAKNDSAEIGEVGNSPVKKETEGERHLFSVYQYPITKDKPLGEYDLAYIYKVITGPRYKAVTEKANALGEEKHKLWIQGEDYQKAKDRLRDFKEWHLDYVFFSGVFSGRKKEGLKKHSQLFCIDVDNFKSKEELEELFLKLIADSELEVLLMFRSPSGYGLKIIVLVEVTEKWTHEIWFKGFQNYMMYSYGVEIDEHCSNVNRACFLCYDPNCYINPKLIC